MGCWFVKLCQQKSGLCKTHVLGRKKNNISQQESRWFSKYKIKLIVAEYALPFSKYCSNPRRRVSSCCSDIWNGHLPGIFGKLKSGNSRFNWLCKFENSLYLREHRCLPAMYMLYT